MLIADEYLVYVSMPLAGSCLFDVVDNPSVKGLMFAADIRLAAVSDTTTKTAICPGSIWPFVPVLEPGFGRRDKSAGGFCPGW